MKKHLIIFFFLLGCISFCFAQPCFPDGITLSTQQEVDNFPIEYPNCSNIGGYVVIGNNHGDISNLDGLSNIDSIQGDLLINNNPNLTGLSGLQNLKYVGGSLHIMGNFTLQGLSGLSSLNHIGVKLIISLNDELVNLIGLESITSVPQSVNIEHNAELEKLTGLENLSTIGGSLLIRSNPNLINISHLESLISVGTFLYIYGNIYLEDLSGLINLTSVGGTIYIKYNLSLNSLNGLDNINYETIGNLDIIGNHKLSVCDIQSICDYLSNNSGPATIQGNASGCKTVNEVEEACLVSIPESPITSQISVLPNPFTTTTTIEYNLNQPSQVTLTIFNNLGKQTDLIRHKQTAGQQQIKWNAEGLPPGIYYFTLQAGNQLSSGKLIIID